MNRFRIHIGDKSYIVEVRDPRQSPMTVVVDGETFSVAVESFEEPSTPSAVRDQAETGVAAQAAGGSAPHVTAPMPGTILDITVRAGDHVQAGQVLCALEAMKMKSPIRAARTGIIHEVRVHEGQTVDYGALLFVLE